MTPEQQARDMLERMGVKDAQSFSAGQIGELANLINDKPAWQPIETAPKDGTDVLVWASGWDNMCVLSWQPERGRWDDGSGDGYQDYQPTRWLAVPDPTRS